MLLLLFGVSSRLFVYAARPESRVFDVGSMLTLSVPCARLLLSCSGRRPVFVPDQGPSSV